MQVSARVRVGRRAEVVGLRTGAGDGLQVVLQRRGAGRVGNKRAPQRKKGGVAHGPVCRDLTEKIPRKMRVKALQIMLSAKLFEDRIILIETEKLDHMKT